MTVYSLKLQESFAFDAPKTAEVRVEIRVTITIFIIYLFNILVDSRQESSIIKRNINGWNKIEEEKYSLFADNDCIARKYQSFTDYQKYVYLSKLLEEKSIVHNYTSNKQMGN